MPPQNLEAEEHILGAMMLSEKACEAALEKMEPDHFYRMQHGVIFSAARSLYLSGTPVDVITLVQALEDSSRMDDAGGKAKMHELAALVPSTSNVEHYIGIVKDAWAKRLIDRTIKAPLGTAEGSAADILSVVEAGVIEVRGQVESGKKRVISGQEAAAYVKHKVDNPTDEESLLGVPTPFPTKINPLKGGRLYVLSGYTGDGKTIAAIQFLRSACAANLRVGFVSVEMSWEDLTDRLIATFGVPHKQLQRGNVHEEHRARAHAAADQVGAWDWEIIDDESVNPVSLARYARLGRYDFLIIDHLHRFGWKERRELELGVRAITNLARTFEIPVLLLAQLRRPWNQGGEKFPRPTMLDLRDSGIIEQEAAAIYFVWRERDEKHQRLNTGEFLVEKNRYGSSGAGFSLRFDPKTLTFHLP